MSTLGTVADFVPMGDQLLEAGGVADGDIPEKPTLGDLKAWGEDVKTFSLVTTMQNLKNQKFSIGCDGVANNVNSFSKKADKIQAGQ